MTNQMWNPDLYRINTAFVSTLGAPLLDLLDPKAGERILDLGCGEGELAQRLQDRDIQVTGIDASATMIAAAQARGVTAYVMDGQRITFEKQFDAVFSNAALHWMPDAAAVLQGVSRSLVPGGRFVGEFGGKGNIAHIVQAIEYALSQLSRGRRFDNPWYFPDAREYASLLRANGFDVTSIELIPRPTPLESGLRGWLQVFARFVTDESSERETEQFIELCEAHARPVLWNRHSGWFADYVRLRFTAQLST